MSEPRDYGAHAPNPQVLFTELDDGTRVLLHLDTKFYYTLNRTAVLVWKSICAGAPPSPRALAGEIAKTFRVEPGVAEADVTAVLKEMVADDLLVLPKT